VEKAMKVKLKRLLLICVAVAAAWFAWNVYPSPYKYDQWMLKTPETIQYYYIKPQRITGKEVERYWIELDSMFLKRPWTNLPEGAEKI
jgi:hypothetical protein